MCRQNCFISMLVYPRVPHIFKPQESWTDNSFLSLCIPWHPTDFDSAPHLIRGTSALSGAELATAPPRRGLLARTQRTASTESLKDFSGGALRKWFRPSDLQNFMLRLERWESLQKRSPEWKVLMDYNKFCHQLRKMINYKYMYVCMYVCMYVSM